MILAYSWAGSPVFTDAGVFLSMAAREKEILSSKSVFFAVINILKAITIKPAEAPI